MPALFHSSTETSVVRGDSLAGADTTNITRGKRVTTPKPENNKSIEQWIWDAACAIPGAKEVPKYNDFICKLAYTRDDGLTRRMRAIAKKNPPLQGIIDRVDFNAPARGQFIQILALL